MEPISFFLSTFTALVDRIVNLEKTKLQDKKDLFNEIIRPLFEELEPVASNYMGIFRNAKKTIAMRREKDLMKMGQYIIDERGVMIDVRIKVREMANQIQEQIRDEETVEFAAAIHQFFYDSTTYNKRVTFTDSLFNMILEIEDNDVARDNAISYIDCVLEILEESWASIVKSYEKIKIHSISPPKFVRKPQKDK